MLAVMASGVLVDDAHAQPTPRLLSAYFEDSQTAYVVASHRIHPDSAQPDSLRVIVGLGEPDITSVTVSESNDREVKITLADPLPQNTYVGFDVSRTNPLRTYETDVKPYRVGAKFDTVPPTLETATFIYSNAIDAQFSEHLEGYPGDAFIVTPSSYELTPIIRTNDRGLITFVLDPWVTEGTTITISPSDTPMTDDASPPNPVPEFSVRYDTIQPRLANADFVDSRTISVVVSEPLDPDTVEGRFTINGSTDGISSVVYEPGSIYLRILLDDAVPDGGHVDVGVVISNPPTDTAGIKMQLSTTRAHHDVAPTFVSGLNHGRVLDINVSKPLHPASVNAAAFKVINADTSARLPIERVDYDEGSTRLLIRMQGGGASSVTLGVSDTPAYSHGRLNTPFDDGHEITLVRDLTGPAFESARFDGASVIIVRISEPFIDVSVTQSPFIIEGASLGSTSYDGDTVTLTLDSPVSEGTNVTIRVNPAASLVDASGNQFAAGAQIIARYDTIPPRLDLAWFTSTTTIAVAVSEPLDPDSIMNGSFGVYYTFRVYHPVLDEIIEFSNPQSVIGVDYDPGSARLVLTVDSPAPLDDTTVAVSAYPPTDLVGNELIGSRQDVHRIPKIASAEINGPTQIAVRFSEEIRAVGGQDPDPAKWKLITADSPVATLGGAGARIASPTGVEIAGESVMLTFERLTPLQLNNIGAGSSRVDAAAPAPGMLRIFYVPDEGARGADIESTPGVIATPTNSAVAVGAGGDIIPPHSFAAAQVSARQIAVTFDEDVRTRTDAAPTGVDADAWHLRDSSTADTDGSEIRAESASLEDARTLMLAFDQDIAGSYLFFDAKDGGYDSIDVTDLAGNLMLDLTHAQFTDGIAPRIESAVFAADSSSVIIVTLSEELDASTVTDRSLVLTDALNDNHIQIADNGVSYANGLTLTITLDAALTLDTAIDIYASTAVDTPRDAAGNALDNPLNIQAVFDDGLTPTITGATLDAGTNDMITVTFSEPLDPETIRNTSFALSDGTSELPNIAIRSIAYEYPDTSLTITLLDPPSSDTTITVTVYIDAPQDPAGNALVGSYDVTYDITAPTITGAEFTSNTMISLTLSEQLDHSTVSDASFVLAGTEAMSRVSYAPGATTLVLELSDAVPDDTTVTVSASDTPPIDLAGNEFAGSYDVTYNDVLAPMIWGADFEDGSDIAITVILSEELDAATVTDDSFVLTDELSGDSIAIAAHGVAYEEGMTLTITLAAALAHDAVLDIAIGASAPEDAAGNALENPDHIQAVFDNGSAPEITGASFEGGSDSVITVTLSEPLDPYTVSADGFALSDSINMPVAIAADGVAYEYPDTFLTITLEEPLDADATMIVEASRSAPQDPAGSLLVGSHYAVHGTPGPSFTSAVFGADGATITATVSRPLSPETVGAGAFTLLLPAGAPGSEATISGVDYTAGTTILVIRLSEGVADGTTAVLGVSDMPPTDTESVAFQNAAFTITYSATASPQPAIASAVLNGAAQAVITFDQRIITAGAALDPAKWALVTAAGTEADPDVVVPDSAAPYGEDGRSIELVFERIDADGTAVRLTPHQINGIKASKFQDDYPVPALGNLSIVYDPTAGSTRVADLVSEGGAPAAAALSAVSAGTDVIPPYSFEAELVSPTEIAITFNEPVMHRSTPGATELAADLWAPTLVRTSEPIDIVRPRSAVLTSAVSTELRLVFDEEISGAFVFFGSGDVAPDDPFLSPKSTYEHIDVADEAGNLLLNSTSAQIGGGEEIAPVITGAAFEPGSSLWIAVTLSEPLDLRTVWRHNFALTDAANMPVDIAYVGYNYQATSVRIKLAAPPSDGDTITVAASSIPPTDLSGNALIGTADAAYAVPVLPAVASAVIRNAEEILVTFEEPVRAAGGAGFNPSLWTLLAADGSHVIPLTAVLDGTDSKLLRLGFVDKSADPAVRLTPLQINNIPVAKTSADHATPQLGSLSVWYGTTAGITPGDIVSEDGTPALSLNSAVVVGDGADIVPPHSFTAVQRSDTEILVTFDGPVQHRSADGATTALEPLFWHAPASRSSQASDSGASPSSAELTAAVSDTVLLTFASEITGSYLFFGSKDPASTYGTIDIIDASGNMMLNSTSAAISSVPYFVSAFANDHSGRTILVTFSEPLAARAADFVISDNSDDRDHAVTGSFSFDHAVNDSEDPASIVPGTRWLLEVDPPIANDTTVTLGISDDAGFEFYDGDMHEVEFVLPRAPVFASASAAGSTDAIPAGRLITVPIGDLDLGTVDASAFTFGTQTGADGTDLIVESAAYDASNDELSVLAITTLPDGVPVLLSVSSDPPRTGGGVAFRDDSAVSVIYDDTHAPEFVEDRAALVAGSFPPAIAVFLSEPPDPASLDADAFTVTDPPGISVIGAEWRGGTAVWITLSADNDENVVHSIPDDVEEITIGVAASAEDRATDTAVPPNHFEDGASITVQLHHEPEPDDTEPPRLVSAEFTANGRALIVQLSEPLDESTIVDGSFTIISDPGSALEDEIPLPASSIAHSADPPSLAIILDPPAEPGSTFRFASAVPQNAADELIDPRAADIAGNKFASAFDFVIAHHEEPDDNAPSFVSARIGELGDTIDITLSAPLDPSSVSASAFRLVGPGLNIADSHYLPGSTSLVLSLDGTVPAGMMMAVGVSDTPPRGASPQAGAFEAAAAVFIAPPAEPARLVSASFDDDGDLLTLELSAPLRANTVSADSFTPVRKATGEPLQVSSVSYAAGQTTVGLTLDPPLDDGSTAVVGVSDSAGPVTDALVTAPVDPGTVEAVSPDMTPPRIIAIDASRFSATIYLSEPLDPATVSDDSFPHQADQKFDDVEYRAGRTFVDMRGGSIPSHGSTVIITPKAPGGPTDVAGNAFEGSFTFTLERSLPTIQSMEFVTSTQAELTLSEPMQAVTITLDAFGISAGTDRTIAAAVPVLDDGSVDHASKALLTLSGPVDDGATVTFTVDGLHDRGNLAILDKTIQATYDASELPEIVSAQFVDSTSIRVNLSETLGHNRAGFAVSLNGDDIGGLVPTDVAFAAGDSHIVITVDAVADGTTAMITPRATGTAADADRNDFAGSATAVYSAPDTTAPTVHASGFVTGSFVVMAASEQLDAGTVSAASFEISTGGAPDIVGASLITPESVAIALSEPAAGGTALDILITAAATPRDLAGNPFAAGTSFSAAYGMPPAIAVPPTMASAEIHSPTRLVVAFDQAVNIEGSVDDAAAKFKLVGAPIGSAIPAFAASPVAAEVGPLTGEITLTFERLTPVELNAIDTGADSSERPMPELRDLILNYEPGEGGHVASESARLPASAPDLPVAVTRAPGADVTPPYKFAAAQTSPTTITVTFDEQIQHVSADGVTTALNVGHWRAWASATSSDDALSPASATLDSALSDALVLVFSEDVGKSHLWFGLQDDSPYGTLDIIDKAGNYLTSGTGAPITDAIAPRIESAAFAPGSADTIIVTVDDDLDTDAGGDLTVTGPDGELASATVITDARTITVTLDTALTESTTVTVGPGTPAPADLAGNGLAGTHDAVYTHAPLTDDAAPEITAAVFTDASTITVTLSDQLDVATVTGDSLLVLTDAISDAPLTMAPGGVSYASGTTLTITLAVARVHDTVIDIAIGTGAPTDAAGNALRNSANVQATYDNGSDPAIEGASFEDGSSSEITVALSEPLDPDTVSADAFALSDASNAPVAIAENGVAYEYPAESLAITLAAALSADAAITVAASDSAPSDPAGNYLMGSQIAEYVIGDTTPPTFESAAFSAAGDQLVVTFSEPIVTSLIGLRLTFTPELGFASWYSTASDQATFFLNNPVPEGTAVVIGVNADDRPQDLAGNLMAADTAYRAVHDVESPTIESAMFASSTEIKVTISEPLDVASATTSDAFTLDSLPVDASRISYTEGALTLAITIDPPAAAGADVTVGVGASPPTDLVEKQLSGSATATYEVDTTPPTFESAAFSAAGDQLVVTFSEPVDMSLIGLRLTFTPELDISSWFGSAESDQATLLLGSPPPNNAQITIGVDPDDRPQDLDGTPMDAGESYVVTYGG